MINEISLTLFVFTNRLLGAERQLNFTTMKENSEIRQESLALLKGNWGAGVGATLLYGITCFVAIFIAMLIVSLFKTPTSPEDVQTTSLLTQIASMVVTIFIIYPIAFGLMTMFLPFVRGEKPLQAGGLFYSLKAPYYGKSIGVYLLTYIFTLLWTLLLIIPGIIKSLSYSLAPYILAENPELTANQAIELSMKMMKGHKAKLFLIWLGYCGFALLSIAALCIPLLWLLPYYFTVFAKFYEEVKSDYNAAAA